MLRYEDTSLCRCPRREQPCGYDRISLGIGEVDWEIDMAIQKFGGNPRTGYRYTAHFSFKGETEMEKERYEEIFNGKE